MDKPLISMDGERARKVLSRSMPRTMGTFNSIKSDRLLYWESQYERDFMTHLEADHSVLRFREQPITTRLRVGGKMQRYTPDIYAEQVNGLFVYEVKPEKKLRKYSELFEAAKEFFESHGYTYSVVTESEIHIEPLLANRKFLNSYARHRIGDRAVPAAKAILLTTGGCPIGKLAELLRVAGESIATVYALIAGGYISAPISAAPIGPNSMVTWRLECP